VWSRVRHRRLQALSLVALSGLLTTCLCLGPLYQRAMEQALAGSVLANATPEQESIRLTASDRGVDELEGELPKTLGPFLTAPMESSVVPVTVTAPDSTVRATRLYAVDDLCEHLEVVRGRCPAASGEVIVSAADLEANGWTVGSKVRFVERLDPALFDELSDGEVTVVGVYEPPTDDTWLGAPLTGRVGTHIQDVQGTATDDWVTDPATIAGNDRATTWHLITSSVVWSIDPSAVGHDELVRIGPIVDQVERDASENPSGLKVLVDTDVPGLAERVATGSEQGRTTVVVLVVQLLVLVAVVLWMVLVAATDDRRAELALARLRGRGRRGAAAYLLSELVPLTLVGVVVGILASPLATALVAKVVFPVPVPHELPGGFLLAALGSAVAVLGVVLAAARRAVREPVDSLLRAVQARHTGARAGAAEVALIVFSLTAVVALVTGNLKGPLATLAPTLLAVAVGLLLGRGLAPATRAVSKRLLRSGRAVAAAGIVNAVRRPAARRILVMVVVATALFGFCADALVTGKHNRQNAAQQENGAPYSLTIQTSSLTDVVSALAAADPDHEHLTPVVSSSAGSSNQGSTLAVDTRAFPRVAFFPLSSPGRGNWGAIGAPQVDPVRLTGVSMAGSVDSDRVRLSGPSADQVDQLRVGLQLVEADGTSGPTDLSVIPQGAGNSVTFEASVPCADGCTVTGVTISTPPGGQASGTLVLRDLIVDGAPFSLGAPSGWRPVSGSGGSVTPAADPAGNLGANLHTSGSEPPVMVSAWVPQPVPALVSQVEDKVFSAPGLGESVDMTVAGTLPRVPGAPPGSRVVDLEGLLRRSDAGSFVGGLEVWSDDASALDRARTELMKRGVTVGDRTTVSQVRAGLDASPAAWSLALSVLVGGAAVLVAMLVMIVATATTWRAQATDLAALRMAGLPDRSLRRMELLGQLPVVVVGSLAGAGCGIVSAVFALSGVRQFTVPPAVDTTDFTTPWALVVGASAVATLLLTALGVATARWTASRAPLNRIREVV
jgi:putative ABC transport system permease protein